MSQICDPRSYHLPKLQFAAANCGTELDAVELRDSGPFKAIVSGEQVEARPIYGSPFTMSTTCKLWFLANKLPRFAYGTGAELRRMRFLGFNQKPPVVDVTLKNKLPAERDGVFQWMLAGLSELLQIPLIPHGGRESRLVLDRFAVSNDPVGAFVAARCQLAPSVSVPKDALREAYVDFCEECGMPDTLGDWFFKSMYERWPMVKDSKLRAPGETASE
jgi:phage/plasmid-associated DNA primase